jgi:hypothetical protein
LAHVICKEDVKRRFLSFGFDGHTKNGSPKNNSCSPFPMHEFRCIMHGL